MFGWNIPTSTYYSLNRNCHIKPKNLDREASEVRGEGRRGGRQIYIEGIDRWWIQGKWVWGEAIRVRRSVC